MSVRTKRITMRKPSGFNYSLSFCVVDTPKGKIRTLTITDHEVQMGDKPLSPPYDSMGIICNDMDLDTNKKELKRLCKFILKELK